MCDLRLPCGVIDSTRVKGKAREKDGTWRCDGGAKALGVFWGGFFGNVIAHPPLKILKGSRLVARLWAALLSLVPCSLTLIIVL